MEPARHERDEHQTSVTPYPISLSQRTRFRTAMILAIAADVLQIAVFPMFIEGAAWPPDDILDLGVGAAMVYLLGWHWEFMPSFAGKLVPGVDLVPLWTLAVANVYRKAKRIAAAAGTGQIEHSEPRGPRGS